MRRLSIAAGGLALLALAGLWIGPRLVNWDAWRGQLAAVAADRLGRPVTLDGPVELTLLPSPVVRAGGVTIAETPGESEGFRVTARMLRVRLDLSSLIAGRIEPRELALVGAELTLPWPPGPILAFRPPAWITQLDARVEDSRVRLGDAVLEGVTATLTSGGPAQAIEIAGQFAWPGRAARFTASLGRPGWDGIAPVELSLNMPEANGRARGVLVPGGGFDGIFEAAGPDLAALVPAAAGPFRAGGRLTATADLIAAEGLTLDLGGAPAR
ncbi:AsmA family protein, partial [Falsiroseomonas oryziterrae]|uniref:AsmA family protein n=1 Tax=Falsiroseomonas oryziterrae TaxID=2911368 RepID=UPI001F29AE62